MLIIENSDFVDAKSFLKQRVLGVVSQFKFEDASELCFLLPVVGSKGSTLQLDTPHPHESNHIRLNPI